LAHWHKIGQTTHGVDKQSTPWWVLWETITMTNCVPQPKLVELTAVIRLTEAPNMTSPVDPVLSATNAAGSPPATEPAASHALSERDLLLLYVRDRDFPCPGCGYNLRALTSPVCPECGQTVRLSVGLADVQLGPWIACLLGISFPSGIGIIVLVILGINLLYGRDLSWRYMPWQAALVILYSIGSIPVNILLIAGRRRFLRLSRPVQRWLGAAPWIVMAVVITLMFADI
jgi:hypothetical protein